MNDALISKLGHWLQLPCESKRGIRELPGREFTVARGDLPLRDIDQTSCSVVMLEGWAARYKDSASGKRIIVEFLLPGDVKLADIYRNRSIGTVMLSPGKVLIVDKAVMGSLLEDPLIHDAFGWAAKVRESIIAEWLVNLASRRAYPRLAHLLCELSMRMNSAGLLDGGVGKMPLTQADLASALGMTNVHLNIALRRLTMEGVLEISNRRLTVINPHRLAAIAEFDDQYLLRWPTRLPDRRQAILPATEERRFRPMN